MVTRNDLCWCGSGKKWKKCHYPQQDPAHSESFAEKARRYKTQYRILLKTPEQIAGIRAASKLAAQILQKLCDKAKAGVTTLELDEYARELYKAGGSLPATLGYGNPPYKYSICTSLNDVICHGIPDHTKLKEGDILNIDVSTKLNGYFGDCSAMVCVGKVDAEKQNVVDVSYQCLMRSIAILKPGIPLCEIGQTIEEYANAHGCSAVYQFVGHGVGLQFHEEPQVMHCANKNMTPLAEGMTFTIEPMINAGKREGYMDPKDKWTVRTVDGKPSAQWEHTILITPTGHEILTLP